MITRGQTGDMQRLHARWPTPAAFYAERDDRTSRALPGMTAYWDRQVEIVVDPDTASEASVQHMALLAANLTARWARRVRLVLPRGVSLARLRVSGEVETLGARAIREMLDADPFGDFEVMEATGGAGPSLRLLIGPWDSLSGADLDYADYMVDATGWRARGARGGVMKRDRRTAACPAAAALAASIGVADLFKRAVGHPQGRWLGNFDWDLWSHSMVRDHDTPEILDPPVPGRLDVGSLLVAGVGAVGSALAYMLPEVELSGTIVLLDRDRIETSNLNRSPLFTVGDALDSQLKTECAAGWLAGRGCNVERLDGQWKDLSDTVSLRAYDVWVSLTNEDGAWASIPFDLPPVVVHGTTSSGWGFNLGRHIPRREDCTMCRLPRPAADFRGPCAEGAIEEATMPGPIRAALPFLSSAAAALVFAELLKLPDSRCRDTPNLVSADLLYGLPGLVVQQRGPTAGCPGCRAMRSAAWAGRAGRTRFGRYSL